ncbi:MAG TPA: glycoside hydrolase family 32 protein [Acidothermaceae bacterium]|jgi:beta-fructofuranosidase
MHREDDHHFPKFHVRRPTGFVNDPNGPILIDDELHLYFQYRAAASGAGFVSWGHASSRDFVNWRHHRLAITPEPDGLDVDGSWSGNTVLNDDRVVAFYSGYDASARYQSVVKAISNDGGFTFGPSVRTVPDPDVDDGIAFFRDPFVWRDGDRWRMVVGAGAADETAAVRLFESPDLADWTPAGVLAAMPRQLTAAGDTGAMWECPQLATLDEQDVLIVSPWAPGCELMQVLTLSGLDGAVGTPPVVGRLDYGANFYAASVLRSSPYGPVVWGWATEGRSNDWCVEADWAGMLTLPRSVSLRPDGTVASDPLPAMVTLRNDHVELVRDASGELGTPGLSAQAELRLDLAVAAERPPVRVRMRFGPDEHLDITVDWFSRTISADRSCASVDPRAHRGVVSFVEPHCAEGAGLSITVYVDGSIIELFTSSGRCATVRMYPIAPPPWGLEILGSGLDDEINCWSLRPAADQA